MNRLLVTVAVTAAIACASSMAHAADAAIKAPPVMYLPPPPQWSGWYVGANLGVGWFHSNVDTDFVLLRSSLSTSQDAGVVGGVHGGYNWQFAPAWVAGIEADIDATSMRATASATSVNTSINASAHVNWLSSLRGRVGYLWTPGLMLYGTAGVAWADVTYDANLTAPGFIGSVNGSRTKDGFVVGAGAEYMWSREWLVRFEYLFYDFNGTTRTFAVVPATLHWDNLGISVLRLGASYKF